MSVDCLGGSNDYIPEEANEAFQVRYGDFHRDRQYQHMIINGDMNATVRDGMHTCIPVYFTGDMK